MGGQQSKVAASRAQEKTIEERMRKMKLQQMQEYDSASIYEKGYKQHARDAEPLPLDAVAALPEQLLAEPHMRYAIKRPA